MASVYVTGAQDALDLICLREYGAQAGVVEQVLEANPHICDIAHALPKGIAITLPNVDGNWASRLAPRLWD